MVERQRSVLNLDLDWSCVLFMGWQLSHLGDTEQTLSADGDFELKVKVLTHVPINDLIVTFTAAGQLSEIHDLFTISNVFLISYCICSQRSMKGHGFLTLVSLYSVTGSLDMKSSRQQIVGWRNKIHQLNVFITVVRLATALKSVTYLKSGTCLLVNGLYRFPFTHLSKSDSINS